MPDKKLTLLLTTAAIVGLTGLSIAQNAPKKFPAAVPRFTRALAVDLSQPVRNLPLAIAQYSFSTEREIRPERGIIVIDHGFSGDAARQRSAGPRLDPAIPCLLYTSPSPRD